MIFDDQLPSSNSFEGRSPQKPQQKFRDRGWRFFLLSCLVIGICFRCVNLDTKVYQFDETFTSLRIGGHTEAEAVQTLTNAGVISVAEVQQYQQLSPAKTVRETVAGLALEEPQLTPLYFVLTRYWVQLLGNSIATIRSFAVVMSLLALVALAWLCWELFRSTPVTWMALALVALSPVQLLYAQEARPPGMWATTILLTSAALLRALRIQSPISWMIYALTLITSLYTFLFSGFVAIAHFLYVAILERFRLTRIATSFLLALLVSFICFAPWLWQIFSQLHQVKTVLVWALQGKLSFVIYGLTWLQWLSVGFVDFNREGWHAAGLAKLGIRGVDLLVLGLVTTAFIFLCRQTTRQIWLLLLLLAAVPAGSLILPDLIWGGIRSFSPRYMMPPYLASSIAVAFLLAYPLSQGFAKRWQQAIGEVLVVGVLVAGCFSCGVIVTSPIWWSKVISNANPAQAQLINQTERPLVISDAGIGDIFSLSHYLDAKVKLLVRPQCYACNWNRHLLDEPFLPNIPEGFTDVFLYNPRPFEQWLEKFKQQKVYQVEAISEGHDRWLWKLHPLPPNHLGN